ncbi:MAG TPA: acyl-CoA dehydrogenase family protein [Acidimicrobiales bacterium]|nr:acyl-CoA dehydrogenase family protein [Acidimicrobiales bacterium]
MTITTTTTDAPVPSLDEFRDEVTAFLDANAERRPERTEFAWGEGDDDVSMFEEIEPEAERAKLAEAKVWRATRYDAGLGNISGPVAYGGRALPAAYDRLYSSLETRYAVPDQSFFGIGLGMVAPTIADHARDHIKARYLPALYRGDLVGCQLFSEPGAGSDLAGLQTRAERDGDEWVVNGQKVWTSGAQYSDIGEVICRTDPDQPKHKGLTGFVVDMHAPGVEVRPLRQMTGGASFNEVFFNDVRIPDDHRLGDVNQGWSVALTTLMNERASIGAGGTGGGLGVADSRRLSEMMRQFGRADDAVLRDDLMRLYTGYQVAKYTNQRALDKIRAGQLPGPEMSIAKLALTRNVTATGEFVARVLGPRIAADTGEWGTFAWATFLTGTPGLRIAGGTDEVLRNIVGERVLGLPKDTGIDATTPFRDLPKN